MHYTVGVGYRNLSFSSPKSTGSAHNQVELHHFAPQSERRISVVFDERCTHQSVHQLHFHLKEHEYMAPHLVEESLVTLIDVG